ncbi:MAG TPA: hypothetical protein VIH11_07830, partial [Gemmatimonadaceae bacterium]
MEKRTLAARQRSALLTSGPKMLRVWRLATARCCGIASNTRKEDRTAVDPGLYGCIAALVWLLHRHGTLAAM